MVFIIYKHLINCIINYNTIISPENIFVIPGEIFICADCKNLIRCFSVNENKFITEYKIFLHIGKISYKCKVNNAINKLCYLLLKNKQLFINNSIIYYRYIYKLYQGYDNTICLTYNNKIIYQIKVYDKINEKKDYIQIEEKYIN